MNCRVSAYPRIQKLATHLEVDLLEVGSGSVGLEGFSEGDDPLPDTWDGTLKDNGVGSEDTVVGETTHGGKGFVSDIVRSSTRLGVGTVADSVDLVVSAGSVVVTVLTGSGDGEHDRRRVPSWMSVNGNNSHVFNSPPIQATFRRPRCVFRGSLVTPQRLVTPS